VATRDDLRRIALALPGVTQEGEVTYRVDGKLIVWPWLERVDPKRARVPNRDVIAVRVGSDVDKQVLLAMDREVFFTEPHYDGYNAVLVRLRHITVAMLRQVLAGAWSTRAPRSAATTASTARTVRRSGSRAPRRRRA
jgi:hypothetical protein